VVSARAQRTSSRLHPISLPRTPSFSRHSGSDEGLPRGAHPWCRRGLPLTGETLDHLPGARMQECGWVAGRRSRSPAPFTTTRTRRTLTAPRTEPGPGVSGLYQLRPYARLASTCCVAPKCVNASGPSPTFVCRPLSEDTSMKKGSGLTDWRCNAVPGRRSEHGGRSRTGGSPYSVSDNAVRLRRRRQRRRFVQGRTSGLLWTG
jgi:hypothetical protein